MAERWQADAVEESERARVSASELSWALRELNRATAEVDRALAARLGLRPLDYTAMNHVMTSATAIGPVDLSHRLGISTGSGTELVDRLERAGHLERRRDHHDRRRVVLRPTPAAVDRILHELQALFTSIDALAADFTPDQQDLILRYLRGAAQRIKTYSHNRPA